MNLNGLLGFAGGVVSIPPVAGSQLWWLHIGSHTGTECYGASFPIWKCHELLLRILT